MSNSHLPHSDEGVSLHARSRQPNLTEVLGGAGETDYLITRPKAPQTPMTPGSVYQERITVQRVLDIGPKVALPLHPGPDLIAS